MVDIHSTIYTSLNNAFGKLRYQAKDDSKAFKAIIQAIMLDDMIEWAAGLAEPESVLQTLVDKRLDLIKCNSAFNIQYQDSKPIYINVNIPQSNDTWKRVWDGKNVVMTDLIFTPCKDDGCQDSTTWIPICNIKFSEIYN